MVAAAAESLGDQLLVSPEAGPPSNLGEHGINGSEFLSTPQFLHEVRGVNDHEALGLIVDACTVELKTFFPVVDVLAQVALILTSGKILQA